MKMLSASTKQTLADGEGKPALATSADVLAYLMRGGAAATKQLFYLNPQQCSPSRARRRSTSLDATQHTARQRADAPVAEQESRSPLVDRDVSGEAAQAAAPMASPFDLVVVRREVWKLFIVMYRTLSCISYVARSWLLVDCICCYACAMTEPLHAKNTDATSKHWLLCRAVTQVATSR